MITNEIIIKAAKAAGLDVQLCLVTGNPALADMKGGASWFEPIYNDKDNAMIMDGAEINIVYAEDAYKLLAYSGGESAELSCVDSKAIARRKAVILIAAAKWDAMQGVSE